MLKLNAIFHRKEPDLSPQSCVVEKVIPLTGAEFDRFSSHMLEDRDFISDNKDLMRVDRDGIYHCLLVTGEGRENGVLIESEGSGYARYAAHVPHVHTVIAAQNQSPALTALGEKLSAFADYAAAEYLRQLEKGESAFLYLTGHAIDYDIYMEGSDTLWDTVSEMIGERLAGHNLDMEIDNGDLVFRPQEPALAEPERTDGPEQSLGMG